MSEALLPEQVAEVSRRALDAVETKDLRRYIRKTETLCEVHIPCMKETIELLARELGAAIHVLRRRNTDITFTNRTLSAWVEWGVEQQQK